METLKINDTQKLYYSNEEGKRNYNGFKVYDEAIKEMKKEKKYRF